MLRLVVVLLLLANLAVYGWRQGWLDNIVGVPAQGDREPGRTALQVAPERVRVLPAPAGGGPAADAAMACLEIGPYTNAQFPAAEGALLGVLPPHRIADIRRETPAVWIVFIGPFPDATARQRRVDELRRQRITFEDIRAVPELGDGLALGRFDNRAAAERALAEATSQGVRAARLAQFAPPVASHTLRVADVTPLLQVQLMQLDVPGLAGKTFTTCTP